MHYSHEHVFQYTLCVTYTVQEFDQQPFQIYVTTGSSGSFSNTDYLYFYQLISFRTTLCIYSSKLSNLIISKIIYIISIAKNRARFLLPIVKSQGYKFCLHCCIRSVFQVQLTFPCLALQFYSLQYHALSVSPIPLFFKCIHKYTQTNSISNSLLFYCRSYSLILILVQIPFSEPSMQNQNCIIFTLCYGVQWKVKVLL